MYFLLPLKKCNNKDVFSFTVKICGLICCKECFLFNSKNVCFHLQYVYAFRITVEKYYHDQVKDLMTCSEIYFD